MNILNIDAYASPKRELQLRGKTYPVKEVCLQSFINNLSAAERLAAASAEGIEAQIRASVDVVCENVPSMPREVVESLNVDQLGKVLEFIRGDLDEGAKSAPATEGVNGAEGEKKVS